MLYEVITDGSNIRRLTNHPSWDLDPAWSADGKEIVFTSYRDGNPEIYRMKNDGSGLKRLTNNPAWDGYPSWSVP